MGKNKRLRKRLASLEAQLYAHYTKLGIEAAKEMPAQGTMNYWRKEIKGRLKEINRIRTKLGLPKVKE